MVKNGENFYGESGREIGKFLHFSPFFTMNTSPPEIGGIGGGGGDCNRNFLSSSITVETRLFDYLTYQSRLCHHYPSAPRDTHPPPQL